MIICHKGSFQIQNGAKTVNGGDAAVFETSNEADQVIKVKAMADDSAFVLLAGQPINEPIFSRGPFVLSSAEELQ